MKRAFALALLILAGCSEPPNLSADESAILDPVAFFAGRSQGQATLNKVFGEPVQVTVASVGRRNGRGGLILDQVIREENRPARRRRWIMTKVGPNAFSGSLTDAGGQVGIRIAGPRAVIRYTMKNGMDVEQHLALQRDRTLLRNRLTVRKFGIQLAQLDESIRKLD